MVINCHLVCCQRVSTCSSLHLSHLLEEFGFSYKLLLLFTVVSKTVPGGVKSMLLMLFKFANTYGHQFKPLHCDRTQCILYLLMTLQDFVRFLCFVGYILFHLLGRLPNLQVFLQWLCKRNHCKAILKRSRAFVLTFNFIFIFFFVLLSLLNK